MKGEFGESDVSNIILVLALTNSLVHACNSSAGNCWGRVNVKLGNRRLGALIKCDLLLKNSHNV